MPAETDRYYLGVRALLSARTEPSTKLLIHQGLDHYLAPRIHLAKPSPEDDPIDRSHFANWQLAWQALGTETARLRMVGNPEGALALARFTLGKAVFCLGQSQQMYGNKETDGQPNPRTDILINNARSALLTLADIEKLENSDPSYSEREITAFRLGSSIIANNQERVKDIFGSDGYNEIRSVMRTSSISRKAQVRSAQDYADLYFDPSGV